MVFIFAATIGKLICDEVKEHKEKGNSNRHSQSHKRPASTSSHMSARGRPSIDKPLPLTPPQREALSPRSSLSVSPIEGRYELDAPLGRPPPYQAYRPPPIPAKEPLMVKVGNDVVPWSPDDIRMPVEGSLEEDLKRPDAQLFELDEEIKRLEAGWQVSEKEEEMRRMHRTTQVYELE